MSRWRIIGKRPGYREEAYSLAVLPIHRGYRESIPILSPSLPSFTVSFLSLLLPNSLSLSLCPHRGARSRAQGSLRSFRLSLFFGSARVISAQEAFDLRFCGERAIKKCRENNIATVKSVALNPPGAGLANCPFLLLLLVFLLASSPFHPCCAHLSHFVD